MKVCSELVFSSIYAPQKHFKWFSHHHHHITAITRLYYEQVLYIKLLILGCRIHGRVRYKMATKLLVLTRVGVQSENRSEIDSVLLYIVIQLTTFPQLLYYHFPCWYRQSRLRLPVEWESASPAKTTRRLMERPTVQHGGTHMERQHRKRDN